jgi:hypothetical protein
MLASLLTLDRPFSDVVEDHSLCIHISRSIIESSLPHKQEMSSSYRFPSNTRAGRLLDVRRATEGQISRNARKNDHFTNGFKNYVYWVSVDKYTHTSESEGKALDSRNKRIIVGRNLAHDTISEVLQPHQSFFFDCGFLFMARTFRMNKVHIADRKANGGRMYPIHHKGPRPFSTLATKSST